jgi:hypothetical protein
VPLGSSQWCRRGAAIVGTGKAILPALAFLAGSVWGSLVASCGSAEAAPRDGDAEVVEPEAGGEAEDAGGEMPEEAPGDDAGAGEADGEAGADDGGGAPRRVLYVSTHGDDAIQTTAHLHREIEAGSDVYLLFTGSTALVPETCPLTTVLGVPPGNYRILPLGGPITNLNAALAAVIDALEEIRPDVVFVQAYAGGHPAHDVTQAITAEALRRVDVSPEVYEFPMQTGYYGRLPAEATAEEIARFWYTLVPLEGALATPITAIEMTPEERTLKLRVITEWGIDWMLDLLGRFTEEQAMDMLDNEKYRPLPAFDYTVPPYGPNEYNPEGRMLYELGEGQPFVFADIANYALNLRSRYGADLWTVPGATYLGAELAVGGDSVSFQVRLWNKADRADTFRLSAAVGPDRVPAGTRLVLDTNPVDLEGGGMAVIEAAGDVSGLSGHLVLWVRADSDLAVAEGDPAHYIEIPLMMNVTP